MGVFSVATWNTEWRVPGSADADLLVERLRAVSPDIICLTEAYVDLLQGHGHLIACDPDHGYSVVPGRHKVMLWSRHPWEDMDAAGHPDLPPGRFVAGRTWTPIGAVQVIGVCIPWRGAHVQTGHRDRRPWQDHLTYLAALPAILWAAAEPTLLIGDFNQRVPRRYTPAAVHDALGVALGNRFRIATSGPIAPLQESAIDHVAHTPDLWPLNVNGLSNLNDAGRKISDHFGVAVSLGSQTD